jgi:hypothetical protein
LKTDINPSIGPVRCMTTREIGNALEPSFKALETRNLQMLESYIARSSSWSTKNAVNS